MSFEKINNNNLDKIHNRKCIMLVNFNKKELSLKVNLKTIEFKLDSSCIYDGLNTYIFILLSMFKTSFL